MAEKTKKNGRGKSKVKKVAKMAADFIKDELGRPSEARKLIKEEDNAYPIDGVVRVTELEAAQFAAKDAEIRNALLSMRNLELEIDKAERAFTDAAIRHKAEQERRRAQYDLLKKGADIQNVSYAAFIAELAQKYKIDPQKMLIDPDTRVIRDSKNT